MRGLCLVLAAAAALPAAEHVIEPGDELLLAPGDTLVLSGPPEALSLAEAKLLQG